MANSNNHNSRALPLHQCSRPSTLLQSAATRRYPTATSITIRPSSQWRHTRPPLLLRAIDLWQARLASSKSASWPDTKRNLRISSNSLFRQPRLRCPRQPLCPRRRRLRAREARLPDPTEETSCRRRLPRHRQVIYFALCRQLNLLIKYSIRVFKFINP